MFCQSLSYSYFALVLVAAIFLEYFTIVEYNPEDVEPLTIYNNVETKVELASISVLTFTSDMPGSEK